MGETPKVVMPWRSITCRKTHRRREIGRAIVEENGSAEEMVAEDAPGSHHPADVGKPEEAVVVAVIEREPDLLAHLREAPGVGMHRAFRLAGSAGSIEDESACIGIERCGWRGGRLVRQEVVPGGVLPDIAARKRNTTTRSTVAGNRSERFFQERKGFRGAPGGRR